MSIGSKIKAWFQRNFGDPIKLQRDAKAIVKVLRTAKAVANSAAMDAVLTAIPGQTDDKIIHAVRSALNRLFLIIDEAEKLPTGWPKNEAMQNAIVHKAGSMALQNLHNIKELDADLLISEHYARLKAMEL
jgi:hypothetical protein